MAYYHTQKSQYVADPCRPWWHKVLFIYFKSILGCLVNLADHALWCDWHLNQTFLIISSMLRIIFSTADNDIPSMSLNVKQTVGVHILYYLPQSVQQPHVVFFFTETYPVFPMRNNRDSLHAASHHRYSHLCRLQGSSPPNRSRHLYLASSLTHFRITMHSRHVGQPIDCCPFPLWNILAWHPACIIYLLPHLPGDHT